MVIFSRAKFYSVGEIAEDIPVTVPTLERFMSYMKPFPQAIYVNSAWHFPEKEARRVLATAQVEAKYLNLDAKEAYERQYGAYTPNVPAFEQAEYMTQESLANELGIDMARLEKLLNEVKRPYPHGYFIDGKWRFKLDEKERLTPILFQAVMKATRESEIMRQSC